MAAAFGENFDILEISLYICDELSSCLFFGMDYFFKPLVSTAYALAIGILGNAQLVGAIISSKCKLHGLAVQRISGYSAGSASVHFVDTDSIYQVAVLDLLYLPLR